jgi:hypothetical protein
MKTMRDIWPYLVVMLLAGMFRGGIAAVYPFEAGDAVVYLNVAQNILENGCVSMSVPAAAECVPHWGGNQLPGYPFFIAFSWFLFGEGTESIRVAQTIVAVGAVLYLMRAVHVVSQSRTATLVAGLVLALSPVSVAWPRHIFTETLAISVTLWLFAELMFSLKEKKLRIWQIALALVLAVFVRMDMLSLCLPVAIAGFIIHRPVVALRRGMVIALLMLIPLSAWSARSVNLGLGPLPKMVVVAKNARVPAGVLAWGNTWSTNEYHLPTWAFPIFTLKYSAIDPPKEAFDSPEEEKLVRELVAKAASSDGQELPVEIDDAFLEIAEERSQRAPWRNWLVLPLKRSAMMWANIYTSGGFPMASELGGGFNGTMLNKALSSGVSGIATLMLENPLLAFFKAVSGGHRIALLLLIAISTFICLRNSRNIFSSIFWISAAFGVGRTLAFALTFNNSTRYIVEAAAMLEVAAVLVILFTFQNRQTNKQQQGQKHNFIINPKQK